MNTPRTPGPWQVTMARFEGVTTYRLAHHVETAIAIDPRGYWPKGYEPPVDEHGYFQPDENMDCAEHRITNACLIAAAPELLDVLQKIADMNEYDTSSMGYVVGLAKAVILKATGAHHE